MWDGQCLSVHRPLHFEIFLERLFCIRNINNMGIKTSPLQLVENKTKLNEMVAVSLPANASANVWNKWLLGDVTDSLVCL